MEDSSSGRVRALLALALAMLTVSMGVGFIAPLLSLYTDSLGGGGVWMGVIFAANPAVRAIFMPLIGRLSDIRGKKQFLVAGLAGSASVAVLMGLAVYPWQLLSLRILQGTFSAMVMPISRAYVGLLTPTGKEGSVMGVFNLSFFLGFSLGPLLGGFLADQFSLRAPFFCMGILATTAMIIVATMVPQQTESPETARDGTRFGGALSSPVIRGLSLGRGFNAMGRGMFVTLLPVYAVGYAAMSGTQIGFVLFIYSLFASSLQPISGMLADRWDRKKLALTGFLLTPLALLLVPQVSSFGMMLVLALVMGLGPGVFVPASLGIAVVEGRKHGMGATMGMVEMSMALGMASGSILGGSVTQAMGVASAFYVMAVVALLGVVPFVWYMRGYRVEPAAG